MLKFTSIFICLIVSISIYGQITISDPQNPWSAVEGSIQNVSFTVNPVGTYAEVSVIYTTKMSDNFSSWDDTQLEFVHDFNLPSDVVFNDSWLWINDYISKGEIYDYSEGTAIYEAIVDRQQDPSILSKLSPTQYHFRIYPMFVDSNRTIKLSYLQPLNIVDGKATVDLPISMLRGSEDAPSDIELTIISDDDWSSSISESSEWEMLSSSDEEATYKFSGTNIGFPTVTLTSKVSDDPYLFAIHEEADEKYFQLHLNPEFNIESESQNVMILYDFDSDNSYEGNQIQVSDFAELINSNDKVIMSYHDFVPQATSYSWSDANNNDVLDLLNNGHVASGSNDISTLLPFTLDRLENMGEDTRLLIFSTSRGFNQSNDYLNFQNQIQNYIQDMSIGLTIDILDMSWSKEYNGQNDRGLVKLYKNLAHNTAGESFILSDHVSYSNALSHMTHTNDVTTDVFNLNMSATEGFTYEVFNSADNNGFLSLSSPVSVYGKIVGDGPYTMSIDAVHEGNHISKDIVLTPNLVSPGGYTASIWASNFLLQNEDVPARLQEVVSTSIEERLLCSKTVFLCLEQDTLSISSNEEEDEWVTVSTSSVKTLDVSVYPNPFATSIKISLAETNTETKKHQILILNAVGTIVADLSDQSEDNTVTWSPVDMASGVYYVRVLSETAAVTKKIIYMKQ